MKIWWGDKRGEEGDEKGDWGGGIKVRGSLG